MADKPHKRMPTNAEFAEAARLTKQHRHDRLPALGDCVAALNKLHEQLADDACLYESEDLQDQRDAVAHSLLAVIDFLRAQGFATPTVAPLMRPVAALTERENNSLDAMFARRARAGRPKATLAQHERTGILAALTDVWLRTHESDDRPQSLKLAEAARKMKGRWFGKIDRAQLETAREFVSQEAKDHPAVCHARLFDSLIVNAAEEAGIESAFAIMIRWLNDSKLPFGAGEGGILKTPNVSPTKDA